MENLDDLTKVWSVGVSANREVDTEPETCREDSDKEDEIASKEVSVDVEVATQSEDEEGEVREESVVEEERVEVTQEPQIVEVSREPHPVEVTPVRAPQPVNTKEQTQIMEEEYDSVYGEFMSLLRDPSPPEENSESGEDSPRAQLLKQFEQEALVEGGLELNFHLPEYAKFRMEAAQDSNKSDVTTPSSASDKVTDQLDDLGAFCFLSLPYLHLLGYCENKIQETLDPKFLF